MVIMMVAIVMVVVIEVVVVRGKIGLRSFLISFFFLFELFPPTPPFLLTLLCL